MLALLLLTLPTPADAGEVGNAGDAGRPNVVMIWSDDLTTTALGCYGAKVSTPNIDRLAARGMRFDRAYCAYPVCGATRLACMAGMDCESIPVLGNYNDRSLTDESLRGRPSMAQTFAAAGYATLRSGKIYHMRIPGDIVAGTPGMDHAADWDETFDAHADEQFTPGQAGQIGGPDSQRKPRLDRGNPYRSGFGDAMYAVRATVGPEQLADALIVDAALDMLTRQQEAGDDQPFYLGIGLIRPHVPFVAPAADFDAYDPAGLTVPAVPTDDRDDIPKRLRPKTSETFGLLDRDRKARALQAYYTVVSLMDRQVGRVVDALDKAGLRDNTIVVFQSDHGWHLGEHDFWQKQSLHEESARIPLVIAGPGIAAGQTDALVSQLDLYPTLCERAGIDAPPHIQGTSLAPLLDGTAESVQDAVTVVYHRKNLGFARLLRTPTHAYIRNNKGDVRALYDMQADPQQFTNLIGQDERFESDLDRQWHAARERLGLDPLDR